MRLRRFPLLAVVALFASALLVGSVPLAAQYEPPDGGPGGGSGGSNVVEVRDNFFQPASITIQAGEIVTWRYVGPSMLHNVREDGGAFRCADGCDGSGGSGAPSAGWEFSLKFDEAGTFRYFCEVHGGPGGFGMAGRVVVEGGGDGGGGGGGEPGSLQLAASSYAADEGAGNVSAGVTRTGGTSGPVSVTLATANGSAIAGQDYGALSRTVSWSDGDGSSKSVSIQILDDSAAEPQETFSVALSGATGGATIGSPGTATVTIRDDDAVQEPGSIGFAAGVVGVLEGAAQAEVPVVRTGGSLGQVSVSYQTADGTARAGDDYQSRSGTLQMANGVERASIVVPILGDGAIEPTETVRLSLSDPAGGAGLGALPTTTLLILDDDESQAALSAEEVLCDSFRLLGFLERLSPEAPNTGETLGVNLSFTRLGDFAGIAYTGNGPATPEAHLAFSTNPEETTLLRNPERPQLFAVSLTRNQTNSDLVSVGSTDQLALFLNPTLELQSPDPLSLLRIDDLGDSVTREGGTPAESKPGRGLSALVQPCHGKLTSRDRHVLQVLSKIARAEMAGASTVKIGLFRGQAPDTYRLDASFEAADGSSMGRLAAELEIGFGPGNLLDEGTLRLLGACTPTQANHCTSVSGMARLQLVRPVFGDELWEDTPYFVSTGGGGQGSAQVDLADLLADTSWRRPL